MEETEQSSKTVYVVIVVITLLIMVGWGIYLIYANSNEKWPFIPYEPPTVSTDTHLYWLNGADGNTLIKDEPTLAKRKNMIEQAIIDAKLAADYDYEHNSILAKTGGVSSTLLYN